MLISFTVKDALLNLLVFLLVFAGAALFFLGTYSLGLALIPGGKGLIFANPWAAALMPSLICGLVLALFRASFRPGNFGWTFLSWLAAFFLLLTLTIPVIESMPAVRAADAAPDVMGRFLPLDKGNVLLKTPDGAVLIPEGVPMTATARAEYDALHERYILANGSQQQLASTLPEEEYFRYPAPVASIQSDFLSVYRILKEGWMQKSPWYWGQSLVIAWLFVSISFLLIFRVPPLVHAIFSLVLARLFLAWTVYALWQVPALIQSWLPSPWAGLAGQIVPLLLLGLTAATCFFLIWLHPPKQSAGSSL